MKWNEKQPTYIIISDGGDRMHEQNWLLSHITWPNTLKKMFMVDLWWAEAVV